MTRGEIYRFGAFELASGTGELRKHGLRLKLQDQPLRILILLVENAGEVVTREQIQTRLWADDTYVDYENAINSAVRKLRDALSDTSANPRFVETLARRGYRFIAPVSRVPDTAGLTGSAAQILLGGKTKPRAFPKRPWVFVAAVLLAASALVSVQWLRRVHPSGTERALDTRPAPPVPLTSYPGIECCPSFSPEGSRVVFSWNGPKQDNFDIYVKQIGPGDPQRLTHDSAKDSFPAWSPDGKWIAFIRAVGEQSASVMKLPSLGGPEREIARINFAATEADYYGVGPALAWSADGNYLFTLEHQDTDSRDGIVRIAVDSAEKRVLTQPLDAEDGTLSISPDGRSLAFNRVKAQNVVSDLFTVPLSEWTGLPQPQRITSDGNWIFGLAWTENGRELVFLSDRGGNVGLWRKPVIGSEQPVRVEVAGWNNDVFGPPIQQYFAISRDGRRLVYNQIVVGRPMLWRIEIGHGKVGKPVLFSSSTRGETSPHFSPDGKKVALRSNQSGRGEIWVQNQDGTKPVQLTSWNSGFSGSPVWSPDGRKIAFDSSNSGQWQVYTINSPGGKPTQLTRNGFCAIPAWSRDGKWVYFTSSRTGHPEIWKIPAEGGNEVQVTRKGGFTAKESVDGTTLFYTKTDCGSALWQMPLGGGQERVVTESIKGRDFAVAAGGIYFVQETRDTSDLRFLQFGLGNIRTIASLGRLVANGLAVSPDERSILFSRTEFEGSDLMLVENFR
jgi:Tol biopolymer transport system component/DNA-binding winged helix-turn-helix (wHTH) protein